MLSLDVPDVDGIFNRAVAAGATPIIAPYDAHWGDRYAEFRDPFQHRVAVCGAASPALTCSQKEEKFTNWRREHDNPESPAPVVKLPS
jgi:hypothetical protein